MDDSIFDDVDAILSEDITADEDKNFNESELQDIMSEIENLEKEFASDDHQSDDTMSLQEQIDAELNGMNDDISEEDQVAVVTEMHKPMPIETVASTIKPKIMTMENIVHSPIRTEIPKSEVSFQAHGQMSFNLDFKVGMDTAKLTVDPVKGLMVTVAGVEFCINEESGCTVSMENGMKFTIPLSNQMNSPKKKAA